MAETPTTKTCGQCSAVHPATNEFFGTDNSQADSLRRVCKTCFNAGRSNKSSPEEKRLKMHAKVVADAKRRLAQPEGLSVGELHKLDQIVRLDEERLAKLQEKVDEQRKAEEAARLAASANPSLLLVKQHFGSHIMLTTEQMREKLAQARVALGNLTGPDDGPAAAHVEKYVEAAGYIVKQRDDLAAEMAKDAQELLNEKVCRRVIGRLMDLYIPQIRGANTAESKLALREKIRARKKSLMAMAKTATGLDKSGAERAVVAKALADALEKLIINSLYAGTKDPLPTDSLENIQSRIDQANASQEWLETEEAKRQAYWAELKEQNPKQFEKESRSLVLQVKGDGHFAATQRKSMVQLKRENPAEYERLALEALKPRKVTQDVIIYVVMEGKREIWFWPDGRLVKKGEEVTYDARMKKYCLMPGPASTELETPLTSQKMELNQHDDGSFHWEPEGSQGTWEQTNSGGWKRTDSGASPWTRPEKIEFRKAPAHVEGSGKDHFRHGLWWSDADIQKTEGAGWTETPPVILPPLPKHALADSLALPPPMTEAEIAKWSREPSVWKRWEQSEKDRKAREAELLSIK